MAARRWTYVLAAAAAVYMVFALWQAWALMRSGTVLGALMGIALLALPLLGLWLVWRELRFATEVQQFADELAAAGALPPELPRRPSGRPTVAAAEDEFARCESLVAHSPHDPAAWFAMSLAYDAGGDRKRARAAMGHALALRAGDIDRPIPPQLKEQ